MNIIDLLSRFDALRGRQAKDNKLQIICMDPREVKLLEKGNIA
jgi:hypothetical protein